MAVWPIIAARWSGPTAFFHLLVVQLGLPFGLLGLSQMTNMKTMLLTQIYNMGVPNCKNGVLTNEWSQKTYSEMTMAKLMSCIESTEDGIALDYAWRGCPLTMGGRDSEDLEEPFVQDPVLSHALDQQIVIQILSALGLCVMTLPVVLALGSYLVNCRALSFGSGRYIRWSWDLRRSLMWKTSVGLLGLYQFGFFLYVANIALFGPMADELGFSWLINTVGVQFIVIGLAIKKVLTGVVPAHNLSGGETFDELVFSRDLVALLSEDNEMFRMRLVDGLFRHNHGGDDALDRMVGEDLDARTSLLQWADAAQELGAEEESCEAE